MTENRQAKGVVLKNGEQITAPVVISNATIWDTYRHLLDPADLPARDRTESLATPTVDSFMHLHLGIRADGLRRCQKFIMWLFTTAMLM